MKRIHHTEKSLAWETWRQRTPEPVKPKPTAIIPDLCSRDYVVVDDANIATAEDILIARIRLHLADGLGGTLIR